MVGNYILGGGALVSKLALEIRAKRGLTYGITSAFTPLPGVGPFIINFATKASKAREALMLVKNIVQTYINDGPTDEEVIAAKKFLVGSFPQAIASNQKMANMLTTLAFYDLPHDFLERYIHNINAVSRKEIHAALKKTIHPQHFLSVMVSREV